MITVFVNNFNTISQNSYDDYLSQIHFHQLPCTCRHSGCLTGHGSYKRLIKTKGFKIPIRIRRVICGVCGKTHALLLSNMIPHSQILLPDAIDIIRNQSNLREQTRLMEQNPQIDENHIHYLIGQYRRHWKQRLCSEQIDLCCPAQVIHQCFSLFGRQFMQVKRTPNLLFLRPT